MAAKSCAERVGSRIFHVFLTLSIVFILFMKDTDLRQALYTGQWFVVSLYIGLIFVGFIFYFVAGWIDPGYVELGDEKSIMVTFEKFDNNPEIQSLEEEEEEEEEEDDDDDAKETCRILVTPPLGGLKLRRCGYCAIFQPLRSKHCEDCGRCVRRYDHHCPWLGTCVGERNHKFFWCFLLNECLLIGWSIEIAWSGFVYEKAWLDWSLANGFLLVAMFVLCLSIIAVFLLFSCHSYLMLTAQTTWECMSRSRISYLKALSEDVNPFDQGVLCNVYGFLCRCRIQRWDIMLRERDRWA